MCLTGAELHQSITSLNLLAMPAAAQDEAVGFLCQKDTLLAHIQLSVHQDPQGPFVPSCSQPVSPMSVLVPAVISPEVWEDFIPLC